MSTDNLALLFRLKGDASQLRAATTEARQAINQLKQSMGPELAQTVSVTNKAFNDVGIGIASLTQRIPVVGVAVSRLTDLLRSAGVEGKATDKAVSAVANSIGSIARESGKSIPQVAQFLTRFTQIKGVAERDSAAVEFFGATLATKLTPELAKASVALNAVSAETAAAGAGLGAIAVPVAAAVIAVAALVAGLVLVSRELFNVTKQAADFQGKMQDLSQQTGVAVETLSTLEVAIATTGGNLNTVTQALVQFQRQMDDAQDPLSKAAGNFEQLGVAVEDTETTLRNALRALAAMPEGFQQTNAAAELFGSRGGKQVLALLKEVNGDIDALQQRLRDTGLLITTDAARAADKFNDELALLEFQVRSLSAVTAKELIPAMTELVRSFNELLQASKPLLGVIGQIAGPTVRAAAASLRGLGLVVQALTFDFQGLRRSIREAREEAAKGIPAIDVPDVAAPPPSKSPITPEREAKTEADALAAVLAAIKRQVAAHNAVLNALFQEGRINRDEFVKGVTDGNKRILVIERDLTDALIDVEDERVRALRARTDLSATEREREIQEAFDRAQKLREALRDKESQFEIESAQLKAAASKERADARRAEIESDTEDLTKEFDRQITNTEAAIARGTQVEAEGLKLIEQLEQGKIDARRESLEAQIRVGFLTVEEQKSINRQIGKLNQDADRLADEQQARRERRQRERAARTRQLKLDELQSLLEAEQIAGESIIALLEAQAALRIRTEESAAREILRIRLSLIDDEQAALQAALTAAGSIINVDERLQAEAEINNRIRVLKAQRAAIEAAGNRAIDDARQQDLDNERDYDDDLQDIREQAIDAQRDAAEEIIRLMIASGARRRDIIRAERDLELAEEEDRHRRETEKIRRQQQETDAEISVLEQRLERLRIGTTEEIEEHDRLIASLERLRAKRAELDAQQAAEDARSQTRKRRVTVETDFQLSDSDLALKDVFDDLGEAITDLGGKFANLIGLGKEFSAVSDDIAQKLGGMLAGAFNQFANALGQTVANWVLLGETGPAVMRKILAQALASLAAEATVQAIKELALGFATLFFNPAESAAHFTAAGLWAVVAGGAALAGRSIAGDLFKPKESTAGAGAGRGGSSERDREPNPIDLARQQQREELHIFVHAEPGRAFNDEVVRAMISDVQRNGPARDVIVKTVGG